MTRFLRWLLLAACIGMGGCTTIAAHYIETPGHVKPSPSFAQALEAAGYHQQDFHARDDVRIAYWYATPRALDITNKMTVQFKHGQAPRLSGSFAFPPVPDASPPATRGSIVLLHPWGQNAAQMAFWGLYFSNAGYVTVMPALRSQGDSGDAPVGYGPREAGDIVQLIHALQRKAELPGPLYLFGVSYGATVALFAAPQLPRVRGVIALEPYVHPVDVIERAPNTGWFAPKWWAHFFSPRTMQKAIARADSKLGIDLATIDPGNALATSHACTLLLRGSDDILISGDALHDLAKRSPRASYVEVPGEGHITLFFSSGLLFSPILTWMQAVPASADTACPSFVLPPAAATARHTAATDKTRAQDKSAANPVHNR